MKANNLRVGLLIAVIGVFSSGASAEGRATVNPATEAAAAAAAATMPAPTTAAPGATAPAATVQSQPATYIPAERSVVPSRANDLADLQAQIPILEARAKIAELQARIAKAGADGGRGILPASFQSAPMPVSSGAPMISAPSSAARTVHSESGAEGMTVTAITGFDGVFRAVINVGGVDQPAVPGAPIPGGWTVKGVTENAVTLVKGKQTVVLRG